MANKAYIDAESKKQKIAQLKTGDLVKLRADIFPIIYHYGFIVKNGNQLLFYHNQFSFFNKDGGNIIIEDFNEYAKGRQIVSVESTGIKQSQITKMVEALKNKKYHFVNNNCEHFVNKAIGKDPVSPQVAKWGFAILSITAVYLILKDKS